MISYDEAIAHILSRIQPPGPPEGGGGHWAPIMESEHVALVDALGMTLAEDVPALVDLPPFANSQMDGYAVIASDTAGASPDAPVELTVVGESAAGSSHAPAVRHGQAVKIFTGAPMPEGADAVVPIEDTGSYPQPPAKRDGSPPSRCAGPFPPKREETMENTLPVSGRAGERIRVDIVVAAAPGQYVRAAGEDFARGVVGLRAGTRLSPAGIAFAAAGGHPALRVYRRPKVSIVSTGDELLTPGWPLRAGHIYDANSYALEALVTEAGGIAVRIHAGDTRQALDDALQRAEDEGADVILTCGGVSVGDRDLVRPAVSARGEVEFWSVAIRPGKPFAFGRCGRALFFGLPGNPASAMVTFELFARPALLALQGRLDPHRPRLSARLAAPVSHGPGRRSFVRARTWAGPEGLMVRPTGGQASHLFRSLLAANSLLVVPEAVESLAEGEQATVILTGELASGFP